jgi:hypothetical protein
MPVKTSMIFHLGTLMPSALEGPNSYHFACSRVGGVHFNSILRWRLCADHRLAPIRRSVTSSHKVWGRADTR